MRSDQQAYIAMHHQHHPHLHQPPHADYEEQPISRTYQYRKVMKPMLERKRRARINRCLDELKELMVSALQHEGENVSKLEKADILELTVRHLHRLRRQHSLTLTPEVAYADKFRAGFTHCAAEVSRCLTSGFEGSVNVDPNISAKLLAHLGQRIQQIEAQRPDTPPASPLLSPPLSATPNHLMDLEASSSSTASSLNHHPSSDSSSSVWRPW